MLRRSQQPWAKAWTRAWADAKAELEAQGRVERAKEWAETEAELMPKARVEWAKEWARRERGLAGALAQELVRARAKAQAKAQVTARAKELAQVLAKAPRKEELAIWGPESSLLKAARAQIASGTVEDAEAKAREAEAQVKEAEVRAKEAEARAQKAEVEAKARAQKAGAEAEAEARAQKAEAEALAVAAVWKWARGQARERGEKMPAGIADLSTILPTLISLDRSGVASDLWDRSPETRLEYSSILHFIAPITRLPLELLHRIFLIIVNEANGPPLVLMRVCKHWYAIVTSIWASLNLGTRTPLSAVTSKLERSQWFLDIVVDTDSDRGDFTPSDGAFGAIFAAIEASLRWRSFVVESFPGPADLSEDAVNCGLQRCPNAAMSRFKIFKVKSPCKTSPFLNGLLHILGTTAGSELTTMEINSANVISFLAPAYPSIFNFLRVLSLDTPGIPNPVDLLPYLHQLEMFTASHISFPIYHNNVDLPFVHTLRDLRLRAASIQWMSGRTFHALMDCTLIFPLHHHVLHTFNTTLPNCRRLTFQGSPLNILDNISAHNLIHLSVTCSGSFNRRGNQQLIHLSRGLLGERCLAPRILHISIEATNQAWISALSSMSDLEELVIESAGPSSLGAKAIQALIFQRVHASNPGARPTPGALCPSLKRLGLKYRRWLRQSEQFNLIPDFKSVISSRERSNYALQSFSIWMTSNQQEALELIEKSRMSYRALEHLANGSVMKREKFITMRRFDWIPRGPRPLPPIPTASRRTNEKRALEWKGSEK